MALELKQGDHIIISVDDSGSMGEVDDACGGLTKYRWMEEKVMTYTAAAEKFSPTGISVHLWADRIETYQNVTDPNKVKQIFEAHRPGQTALGSGTHTEKAIDAAWKEHKARGAKSTYLLVWTDGDATDREGLKKEIVYVTKQMASPEEFRILFLAVGTEDASLKAFMEDLDENMDKEGAVFDIVGVVDPSDLNFEQAISDAIGSTTTAEDVKEGHGAAGKVTPHFEQDQGTKT